MDMTRRKLITSVAGSLAGLYAAPALASAPSEFPWQGSAARSLSLLNLHTGERAKSLTYFEHGRYVPGALAEINKVLRDHRTGDVVNMDPKLMDLLHVLQRRLGSQSEIEVISAYRSPASNAKLAAQSGGVAKKSYHMRGMAMDIALEDRSLRDIQTVAKALNAGGVGRYSKFVHVDTGPVRSW